MKRRNMLMAIAVISFVAAGILPGVALGLITLGDNGWSAPPPGEDPYGEWDSASQTGTLTRDVTEEIEIVSNGVTLDGNGKSVTRSGPGGYGVWVSKRTGVTIKNLQVTGFSVGIFLVDSHGNTLTGNTVLSSGRGGIALGQSDNNKVTGNTASYNQWGISLGIAVGNVLTDNTVSNNDYGIQLEFATDNEIYNNNFIDNTTQALIFCDGNLFNLASPVGGNFWSDWTSPDDDHDGFVDYPYRDGDEIDWLPWTKQDGWKVVPPEEAIGDLIGMVVDLNIQEGIANSLDGKLDGALGALDDLNENNNAAAINSLQAFINAVEAQRGKKISEEDADALIAAAEAIIAALLGE